MFGFANGVLTVAGMTWPWKPPEIFSPSLPHTRDLPSPWGRAVFPEPSTSCRFNSLGSEVAAKGDFCRSAGLAWLVLFLQVATQDAGSAWKKDNFFRGQRQKACHDGRYASMKK